MPSTLIIETGVGVPGADSYVATSDIDTYAASSPIGSFWLALTQATKDNCARQATRYLDAVYASPTRLTGRKQYPYGGTEYPNTQGLEWPRAYCFDRDGVPVDQNYIPPQWVIAQQELSLRSAKYGDLSPDINRRNFASREAVGSLSIAYMPGTPPQRTFPYIEMILAQLLQPATLLQRG